MSEESKRTLEQILDEVEGQGGQPTASVQQESITAPGVAPTGGALSSLLTSPQLLQAVGSLSSLLSSPPSSKADEKTADKDTPNARALLAALRPYLGEHRRTTIDGMLQLLQLRSLLQSLPLQQLLRGEPK